MKGMLDVRRHRYLTLRASLIGAVIGIIPGLGGDAASWVCYGHAVQSSKTPEAFGKGPSRASSRPEAANNSKEGGCLLPTLFFGIPGCSGMAVMLGAFVMLGIPPGPVDGRAGPAAGVDADLGAGCRQSDRGHIPALHHALGGGADLHQRRHACPVHPVVVVIGAYVSEGQWENLRARRR